LHGKVVAGSFRSVLPSGSRLGMLSDASTPLSFSFPQKIGEQHRKASRFGVLVVVDAGQRRLENRGRPVIVSAARSQLPH